MSKLKNRLGFGPVDLTGLKPDKLPRLIDLPGVKELIEAAWRKGFNKGRGLAGAKYPKLYEDNYVFEYMKRRTEDGKNDRF